MWGVAGSCQCCGVGGHPAHKEKKLFSNFPDDAVVPTQWRTCRTSPEALVRGVGVSKVFQAVGRWQTLGKESLCRLRGQQLYDTTRCGVWQGVASAVGRVGTQHMGRTFLNESSLPPFLYSKEEWGPSMLQATDQLLLLVEVTGGPKEFLLCSFGLVLAARGTGGPRDLMRRRLHEGGKQHTPTGIPWGRLVALCCRALPGLNQSGEGD